LAVVVFNDRIVIRPAGAATVGSYMESFAAAPAVVAAFSDDVDFLPLLLADIADPQDAGLPIETPAPGISQAVGIDFRQTAAADIRVVGRNTVGRAVVDVDPQNLAKPVIGRLRPVSRIVARTAVAEADVQ